MHPVLDELGWWRRNRTYEGAPRGKHWARPLLIVGASGTLGRAFARACDARGLAYERLDRERLDITQAERLERALTALSPWAVINAAGYVRVDDAEREHERCMQINVEGSIRLASACRKHALRLLTFSSDLVFDGKQQTPYLERDPTAPLGVYGRSKAEAERKVFALHEDSLVVRTSAFFGPHDEANFVTQAVRTLRAGGEVRAASDTQVSPTYVPHLVDASLDLLIDGERGVVHLTNRGSTSWFELARSAARALGLDEARVVPCRFDELDLPAPRPAYSVLSSERTTMMPSLEDALAQYASHVCICMHGGTVDMHSVPGCTQRG